LTNVHSYVTIVTLKDIGRSKNEVEHRTADITFVTTASSAISKLQYNEFDKIYLDHNLVTKTHCVSGKGSGYEVAEWIATNLDYKPRIVIHSMNYLGAIKMQGVLEHSGFSPKIDPFYGDMYGDIYDWNYQDDRYLKNYPWVSGEWE